MSRGMKGIHAFSNRKLKYVFIVTVIFLVFTVYFKANNKTYSALNTTIENNVHFKSGGSSTWNTEVKFEERVSGDSSQEVYIVEEHHEVLPVWFDAVSKGKIPATGNTLVHIDGHSDMGVPDVVRFYPMWRLPRNSVERRTMIQKNDVFIQAAVIAGLIDRVVWVWPTWTNISEISTEFETTIFMGVGLAFIRRYEGSSNSNYFSFCLCEYNTSDETTEKKCFFIPEDGKVETYSNLPDCKVKRRYAIEIIREDAALTKFETHKDFIKKNENILLDIDEDFYGCSYGCRPLLEAGWLLNDIEKIDATLSRMFCPNSSRQEHDINLALINILEQFKMSKSCDDESTVDASKRKCRIKMSPQREIEFMKMLSPFLCRSVRHTIIKNSFLHLMYIFNNITDSQLGALQYVGFCLRTTPKTFYENEVVLQTCSGINTPNDSAVLEYNPNPYDIRQRSKLLTSLLSTLKDHQPRLTTLCRSVRDGYTPREHFQSIEKNVISSVESAFHDIRLHYDIELLGGKEGWPSRHRL